MIWQMLRLLPKVDEADEATFDAGLLSTDLEENERA